MCCNLNLNIKICFKKYTVHITMALYTVHITMALELNLKNQVFFFFSDNNVIHKTDKINYQLIAYIRLKFDQKKTRI